MLDQVVLCCVTWCQFGLGYVRFLHDRSGQVRLSQVISGYFRLIQVNSG
jgi:hypothetical protein